MKISKEQIEEINKVAEMLEKQLDKPLTKQGLSEIDQKVTEVLAELGHYRRFFKRLS